MKDIKKNQKVYHILTPKDLEVRLNSGIFATVSQVSLITPAEIFLRQKETLPFGCNPQIPVQRLTGFWVPWARGVKDMEMVVSSEKKPNQITKRRKIKI
jgi:hypothetical protein